jgi:hypothetical protein
MQIYTPTGVFTSNADEEEPEAAGASGEPAAASGASAGAAGVPTPAVAAASPAGQGEADGSPKRMGGRRGLFDVYVIVDI